jgi:LysR family transcriptional regulator, nitrogen assimilation regulatory protein
VDTHRLRYFLQIAEEGSISRAARVLAIAQPALSRQLHLLEKDLGVALFRRTARGVELTEEGEQLRASTAAPLRQLELAMQWVGSPLGRVERKVVLGMPSTAAVLAAGPLLSGLTLSFPGLKVRISVADSARLVDDMMRDEIDFALVNGPPADERPFYNELLVEPLVLVGGVSSGLRPDSAVRFAALAEFPLILPTPRPGLDYSIQHTALRQKITLISHLETDSLVVSKRVIEDGGGFAILPLSACVNEVQSGRLSYAPLVDPVITQQVGLAVRPHLGLPRGFVTQFGTTVRDEIAALVTSGVWPATLLATQEWRDDPHSDRHGQMRPVRGMTQGGLRAVD